MPQFVFLIHVIDHADDVPYAILIIPQCCDFFVFFPSISTSLGITMFPLWQHLRPYSRVGQNINVEESLEKQADTAVSINPNCSRMLKIACFIFLGFFIGVTGFAIGFNPGVRCLNGIPTLVDTVPQGIITRSCIFDVNNLFSPNRLVSGNLSLQ